MEEKQDESSLESDVNQYVADLPTEIKPFYDTMPKEFQGYFQALDLYEKALKGTKCTAVSQKAVEYSGLLFAASLLDKTREKGTYLHSMAQELFKDYAETIGWDTTKIDKYLRKKEEYGGE